MLIITNRFIPFGRYYAINLFGVVFVRRGRGPMSSVMRNHEYIHTLQQRELLYVGFYVWYVLEWFLLLLKYHHPHTAYCHISFEREAYARQNDLDYRHRRRHYAWLRRI